MTENTYDEYNKWANEKLSIDINCSYLLDIDIEILAGSIFMIKDINHFNHIYKIVNNGVIIFENLIKKSPRHTIIY